MKIIPSEAQEQSLLHQYCLHKKLLSFAIPNGGSRHKLEAINLKKQGVVKGVSDYVVMLPNVILFIEMKRQKKSVTSKEQREFIEKVNQFPYAKGFICKGANEAIKLIEYYTTNHTKDLTN